MRTTKHNGRKGKGGNVYNPRHNDRTAARADKTDRHINDQLKDLNVYTGLYKGQGLTFEEIERKFYQESYGKSIEARNDRYRAQRHPERCRTVDAVRLDPKTAPEETILQIGDRDTLQAVAEHTGERQARLIMRSILIGAINDYMGYMRQYGGNVHILNVAIHADEAVIHAHMRTVYDHTNERGERAPGQKKALEACGILPPHPEEPEGRYNSRKMTFDREGRAEWLRDVSRSIEKYREKHPELKRALEPLKELETVPEASREHRELNDYIAEKQQKQIREQEQTIERQQAQIDRQERQIEYIDAFRQMVKEAEDELEQEQARETHQRHRGRDYDLER